MGSTLLDDLRTGVRGEVVARNDAAYDEARKVNNAMHDRRPLAIVRASDVADVIATVRAVRDHDVELAVRAGGHAVAGFGTLDDGVVVDLQPMTGIRIDPWERTARVQTGCTWGDLDHATHVFGLATTGGLVSTTGVSGLTLGGGIGYLARAHGLSLDNLLAADVVTADGTFLHASPKEHADLFWALRGGGGNFGIVTELQFRLHEVDHIFGGPMLFELDDAEPLLRTYRDWIARAPRAMGAFPGFQIAPPLPFIPEERHGAPFVIVVACFNGPADEGAALLDELRDVATPVAQYVDTMPYPALNSMFDPLLPPGLQHYWKANFVTDLTDEAIAAHLDHGPRVPSLQSTVHLYPIDGAVHDVAPTETAFAHREANFAAVIAGMWEDPADSEANIRWVRDYYAAIAPHSEPGGYVNFMAGDDQDRVRDNYGGDYARLVEIKRQYDPDNVFHLNQNIVP